MAVIRILRRWTDAVLYETEAGDLREAVVRAVANFANLEGANLEGANLEGANLRGANLEDANLEDANLRDASLRGANLEGANLRDANLGGANLEGANLGGASLRGANLEGANLRDANLGGANLEDANLRDASLRGANLRGANLRDASLRGANLEGADLRGANLAYFRDDVWAVLSAAPKEAGAVLTALEAGTVDGSSYAGDCACLVGTIANARGCNYAAIPNLTPSSSRPAEQWFLQIRPGQTPANHAPAKLAAEWVRTWLETMRAVGAQV